MSKLNKKQRDTFERAAKKYIKKTETPKLFDKIKKAKTKKDIFDFSVEAVKKGIDGQVAYRIAKSVLTQKEIDTFSLVVSSIPERKLSAFRKKISIMLHHTDDKKLLKKAMELNDKAKIYLFTTKNLTDRFGAHSSFELMSIVMSGKEIKGFFLASDQAHHPVVGYAIASRLQKTKKAA